MPSVRRWFTAVTSICLLAILASAFLLKIRGIENAPNIVQDIHDKIEPPVYPKYKPVNSVKAPEIVDNFPLALAAHSAAELPPIPRWSNPPEKHVPERTPLFIGFTRNWRLLQQVVVSYITSGWPPEDIYVVENTGVMDANKLGQLSLQNPFFLNHTRLNMLGVNVLITPTLFTFAQLQNFYLWTATVEKYPFYFWSHMDILIVPYEMNYKKEHKGIDITKTDQSYEGFRSVYDYCLEALHEVLQAKDEAGKPLKWALRFFSYDRLTLVNTESFRAVGGWDTLIPFYMTDCDMHARIEMEHYSIMDKPAGMIWDVASSLDDLIVLYRKTAGPNGMVIPRPSFRDLKEEATELSEIAKGEKALHDAGWVDNDLSPQSKPKENDKSSTRSLQPRGEWVEDRLDSDLYAEILRTADHMQNSKNSGDNRNHWQVQQTGGIGDPFYRDAAGFEEAIQITIEHGRHIFREKWGHRDCDIVRMGLKPADAWKVMHDWRD